MTVTLAPATDLDRTVEEAFSRVDGEMVLAAPLGVGKSIRSVNAVYRYASDHPDTRLTIVTALTLDDATPSSELGRRLADLDHGPAGMRSRRLLARRPGVCSRISVGWALESRATGESG